ncbi:PREDICTED: zinc finger protein 62-like isoform X1 [Nicrophorus vespilloides]|uniref:Zinc finger protein 62-like isoform X1 n=1 Tax=Nicrophorus vespilloides TaxID=110193 RepID=A0ABM1MCX9_NICVS|nr:PREDICTED: zinc finger protein 62-like isoform X1 [Nicrophorus vespilloides]
MKSVDEVPVTSNQLWSGIQPNQAFPIVSECLPFIGESQVNSILLTLDDLKNLHLIICDACLFVCLDESRMIEHKSIDHKDNTKKKNEQNLQCPVCPNTFQHKLAIDAHLKYDHYIDDPNDVSKIIYAIEHKILISKQIGIVDRPVEIKEAKDFSHKNVKTQIVEENESASTMPDLIQTGVIIKPKSEKSKLKVILANKCSEVNCKVTLQSLEKLQYHKQCHKGTVYECPECNELFSIWKFLTGHLWRQHNIDMELHCCDECDYRTYSLSKLNNTHKLTHGTSKNFKCDLCEKSFKNAKQLRNHKDTHKQIASPKFQCTDCSKLFSNRQQLRMHIDVVHKKLKPFLCSYCGYKSATKSALKMHIRQHTGEKPFTCDICDYSTTDHNSLRRHKLRHSNEKPYKCSQCDYQCIQSSAYKVHVKTKHPGLELEVLFSCRSCQFQSINRDVYNCHIASHHQVPKTAVTSSPKTMNPS